MREAHAVRISDILARLNQLRAAGELQFLEKLPVVEQNVLPAVAVPAEKTVVPADTPVVPVEEPVVPAEEPVVPVEEPLIPAEEPVVSVEEPVIPVEDPVVSVEEPIADDISGAGEDDSVEVIISELPEADDEISDEPVNIPVMPERGFKKEKEESFAPDKLQKSIANTHPQELFEIINRDPVVKEAVDLFSGTVIDIHR